MNIIPFIPILIVIIVVVKFKRYINRFKDTGTTTPETAKSLEELNLRHWLIFNRLIRQNVIINIGAERYYLHEENFEKYTKAKRTRVLIIFAFLILILLIYKLATGPGF
jgi:uncharacterized membrane-anchored protein